MKKLQFAVFDDPEDSGLQIIHFFIGEEDTTELAETIAFDLLGDKLGIDISRKRTMGWILSDIYDVTINNKPLLLTDQEMEEKELI
jgi:hypothetical protein